MIRKLSIENKGNIDKKLKDKYRELLLLRRKLI